VYKSITTSGLPKSPGTGGLPAEFYELLIELGEDEHNCVIAEWLQAVYIHSFRTGLLPEHMRRSQIRLLYKKDTEYDKRYPKNYRPIAFLNVDYKFLSKILATKLKEYLPSSISEDQYAIPGRYMDAVPRCLWGAGPCTPRAQLVRPKNHCVRTGACVQCRSWGNPAHCNWAHGLTAVCV
jgi:hypothetical protein